MAYKSTKNGFTVIELLIVVGIIAIGTAIGANLITGKSAARRSVDNITNKIATTLTLNKIKSTRNGVEYRVNLTYDGDEEMLNIQSERGDSNRASTNYNEEMSFDIKVLTDATIVPTVQSFTFSPRGTLVDSSGSLITSGLSISVVPSEDSSIKKCGVITMSGFGRISPLQGRWDEGAGECKAILDEQSEPQPPAS